MSLASTELEKAGFARDQIGLLVREEAVEDLTGGSRGREAVSGAGIGALGGGALGALITLLAAASSIALPPPLGPLVAGGALANLLGVTAAGAGVGAAYGALAGALTGYGVADEHIDLYAEGLAAGGLLLAVETQNEATAQAAREIMENTHGSGVDIYEAPAS